MARVAGRHTTTEIGTERNYVLEQGLVPFLPDDVALQCLLRVPAKSHPHLRGVCRKWRDLVNSRQFYELRQKEGTTGRCTCLLQAMQQRNSHQAPVFGVSLLNEKNSWGRLPQLPDFDHHSLPLFCRFASVEGNLVVRGGWDPSTTEDLQSVYIFSFSSRTWRRGADMPTTRSFFSCGALNGHILVAGGHDADKNALRSADCYNLRENCWKSLPNMSAERDECAGAVLDGKFYIISGYPTLSQGESCRDAEIYDPELNKWMPCPNMFGHAGSGVQARETEQRHCHGGSSLRHPPQRTCELLYKEKLLGGGGHDARGGCRNCLCYLRHGVRQQYRCDWPLQ
ncbi:F-box/kelch-repeat protein At2g44130 [Physcomitrium patens]|uniref:F-box domain-containing protein n=1 Tax=Physcomitrium patens TaxID=3218 RepID=A0A2K1L8Z9_PHYPA|nr:F-box/kelch-repeat protein At2g44130-like [Physcomitrium patens]PNR62492.1 hypothetical protein PHYPA_000916 [Physcomitrium patens]|eukprot:XP_024378509.1 F-box/kelch-repeat protein At2g44130-like [Physcomitrella patens]